jgi:hypothetical protein
MRDYGKINSSFWMSESVKQLSDDGKMLALYLLTCPHGNMLGCFRIPDGYVSDDLGWPIERVSKGFVELFNNGFARRCETSKWVLIFNFLEYNPFENPNVGKAAAKVYASIPDKLDAKSMLTRILAESCPFFPKAELNPLLNPSETLPNSARNPEPEPEPNQNQNLNLSLSSGAEKSAPPQKTEIAESAKPETDLQAACRETWKFYSDAYFARYEADPVRNATINTQVKAFVKRIGAEEAPHVAAFFVQSNAAFYVQRGHTFGNLLADAEKLRTEWATGRTMTGTRARQIDQTQANFSVVGEAMKILEAQRAEIA